MSPGVKTGHRMNGKMRWLANSYAMTRLHRVSSLVPNLPPCNNQADTVRKLRLTFSAGRADQKNRDLAFCATVRRLASSFRTVCKFFAADGKPPEIKEF
jgi:hypothetical protein